MDQFEEKFERVKNELQARPFLTQIRQICKPFSHITEFGTGEGYITVAVLASQPEKFISYDSKLYNEMQSIVDSAEVSKTDFKLIIKNVLNEQIEPTQVLILNTKNTFNQLLAELTTHCKKVENVIAVPRAHTFDYENQIEEVGKKQGLRPAIEEFLQINPNWEMDIDDKQYDLVTLKRNANPK